MIPNMLLYATKSGGSRIMRTAIFFSGCDGLFDGEISFDSLASSYRGLTSVKIFKDFFDPAEFNDLLSEVESKEIDSLVLVGDSHYSYQQTRNGEYLFKRLEEKGINQNKVEIVNLKNLVLLPHKGVDKAILQEKAKLMINAGIEKLMCSHNIDKVEVSPRKSVAIIGVSAASFIVAQHLLDEGFKVFLVNNKADATLSPDLAKFIGPTVVYALNHNRLFLYNNALPTDFHGYPGDFSLTVAQDGKETEIPIGAVVLSLQTGGAMNKTFQSVFHVDVNKDGSLAALDDITARSLTQDRGVFVINPVKTDGSDITDNFSAADAASSMVINMINQKEIYHSVKVSEVKTELCSGCGACVKTCMFKAVTLAGTPLVSHIDPRRCRGCGNCVTACPADARDLVNSPNKSLFSAIEVLSQFNAGPGNPRMLLLACEGCGYRCLNSAAEEGLTWPVGVMPLQVICGGQIDTRLIMHAFVKGFDMVALAICGEGCCHNIIGNVDLERRANLFRAILESRGIEHERMKIISTCSRKGAECVEAIHSFLAEFNEFGKGLNLPVRLS